jgi:glycosyltransferase involved in cell wall biosynthesis
MNNPKVSVVMSVYNGGEYLKQAIASILEQTFVDFEFIIINDGSTDNSEVVIKGFSDSRIKLVSRNNKGLIVSLNEGLALAQGEYIARMDADDIAHTERLSKQVKFLDEHRDIALLGTWVRTIDEVGEVKGEYSYPPQDYSKIKSYAILHNPFIHPTVMFRKAEIVTLGGYSHDYKHIEDYELWSRVLKNCRAANLPEMLLDYRVLAGGITKSHNLEMRLRGLKVRWLVIKRLVLGI